MEEITSGVEAKRIGDYFNLDKEIENAKNKGGLPVGKKLKIAILSSFTARGVKEVLNVECCRAGITSDFYVCEYNQYAQDIFNPDSVLCSFNPDLVIFFIDTMSLLGEIFFSPYQMLDEDRRIFIKEKKNEIKTFIEALSKKTSAKIIFHNFEVPIYSPLGILENKQDFGFQEMVEQLNFDLREEFKASGRVFIFDYNSFCSKIGKNRIVDPKMYYLADIKLGLEHLPDLCLSYLSYIKPMVSLGRKCLVLDLDNTLWGGIIGEDGLEGIKLGPTPEGRPFLEFQKYILSLFNKGVILAINSKNNPEDVSEVFRRHPYMILKEEHFAAMQINWDDKIANMKIIAKQIDIGLDSLVFIDDSEINREMVKRAIPQILVINLPDDSSLYVKTLMAVDDFDTLQITEEDKQRGKIYASQRKRQEIRKNTTDLAEYLRSLDTLITFEKAKNLTISRISQLTQKTNQFNLTTRRYFEEDIKKFSESDNYLIVSLKVEDKYGDNGITGVAIVEKSSEIWRVDTFLLSCRIIGREVEKALLAFIIKNAKKEEVKKLRGEFISTSKNAPAKNFYRNNGFKSVTKDGFMEIWEVDIKNIDYSYPDFLNIKEL